MDPWVVFSGFAADPLQVASAYDIAVSNSDFEGFPNTVVEYFAAGRPVVTTDAGGVEEMVNNHKNGILVPAGDDDRLYDAIALLIENDALRETFSGNIARLVSSGDPVTRRYLLKINFPVKGDLLPGMFGRAIFIVGHEKDPVIPKTAIVTRAGLKGVFLVEEDQSVKFRWIRTGREWPDKIQINAGIIAGQRIVAEKGSRLRDGDKIIHQEADNER